MKAKDLFTKGTNHYLKKEFEEALKFYGQAISLNPAYTIAYINRGIILSGLNRKEEALHDYNQAIAINPQYPIAYINRGITLSELNRKEEALHDFNLAINLDPEYAVVYQNRGLLLDKLGRKEEALSDFNLAISLDPEFTIVYNSRGLLLKALNRKGEALNDFNQATNLIPQYTDAYINKGLLLSELNRKEEALENYNQALTINPKSFIAYANRGVVLLELERKEEALFDFNKAIEINPEYANSYNYKGAMLWKSDQREEALINYNKAIEINPYYANAYSNRGVVLLELNRKEEALINYNQAIALNPKDANTYNNRGLLLSELNQEEKALVDFNQAIAINPNYASAYSNRALVFWKLDKKEKALNDYNQAIIISPENSDTYYSRGTLLLKLNQKEKALVDFNQVIAINPEYLQAYCNRGTLFLQLNQKEKALVDFNQAIAINPNDAVAWHGIGSIYQDKLLEEKNKLSGLYTPELKHEETIFKDKDLRKEARVHFNRSLFFCISNPNNLLRFYSNFPDRPFLTYRLFTQYPSFKNFQNFGNLAEKTLQQSQHLLAYISYLILSGKDKKSQNNLLIADRTWYQWLGIVNYQMGDEIKAFEIFTKELLPNGEKDLRTWYYLILSCLGFCEDTDPFIEQALEIAVTYQPEKQSFGEEKKKLNSATIRQRYYAGLLFEFDEEPETALEYFESIQSEFLPAAYKSLQIKYQLTQTKSPELIENIIKMEDALLNSGTFGFASGFPPIGIDLKRQDWMTPFFHYFYYDEVREGIQHFYYAARKQASFECVRPDKIKPFWELWTIKNEDFENIFQLAKNTRLRDLTEKILKYREDQLDQHPETQLTPQEMESRIRVTGQLELITAYNSYKDETNSEIIEKGIGVLITEWKLLKMENFFVLIDVFYLQNQLTSTQKILLEFYLNIRNHTRQRTVNDSTYSGVEGSFKNLVGAAFDFIESLAVAAVGGQIPFAELIIKPFTKSKMAKELIGWLKAENPAFRDYPDFKDQYRNYLGAQIQDLGYDKFNERFPFHGLENLFAK